MYEFSNPETKPTVIAEPLIPETKMGSFRRLFQHDIIRLTIFATLAWFLFDVGDYGTIVFTPTIFSALKGSTLQSTVIASGLTPLVSLVGIFLMWLLVDKVGRKSIQVVGFGFMGIVFIFMAFVTPSFDVLLPLFLLLYIFMQGGPGQTTYIYPGEIFPTSVRATGHGLATAVSRIGGLLGTFVFPIMISAWGLHSGLLLFGGCAIAGAILTIWLAPESKGKELTNF